MATVATKPAKSKTNRATTNSGVKAFTSVIIPTSRTIEPPAIRRIKEVGFRAADFLKDAGLGKVVIEYDKSDTVFSQGDSADHIFYVQKGKVKIGVVSAEGKEATVAVLGMGEFVGEDCIATTTRCVW